MGVMVHTCATRARHLLLHVCAGTAAAPMHNCAFELLASDHAMHTALQFASLCYNIWLQRIFLPSVATKQKQRMLYVY